MKYYVPEKNGSPLLGTAALDEIAKVRVALDQANGLRDAAGNPTTKTMYVVRSTSSGVPPRVDRDAETGHVTAIYGGVVESSHVRGGRVTSDSNVILGDDGTAALELPDELDEISDHLGKTVRGNAIPSRVSLVTEAQLPKRVKAKKENERAVEALEAAMGTRGLQS
jgi:hypothetical protein